MRLHPEIAATVNEGSQGAAVSHYRPTEPAPVKRFTRGEIRAYIKQRGKA